MAFDALPDGAFVVAAKLAQIAAPPEELTASQWSNKYRVISAESGSRDPGQWRTSRVPYTREIMDEMGIDAPSRKVWLAGGAQGAKTQSANNAMGHCIHTQPRSIMLVAPSGDKLKKWNRKQFDPMVSVTEVLRDIVLPTKKASEEGSTVKHKRFRGGSGSLTLASASTENDLQSESIGYLFFEEPSSYPKETEGRGSPIDQARERLSGWGDEGKEVGCGTTGEVGACVVTAEVEAGDHRRYYTPCPHCDSYYVFQFEHMQGGAPRDDGTVEDPIAVTPCCGSIISQAEFRTSLQEHPLAEHPHGAHPVAHWPDDWQSKRGGIWIKTYRSEREVNPAPPDVIEAEDLKRWRGRASEGRHVSFHFWQGQSPLSTWSSIWSKWLATKIDPEKLVTFYQQVLAKPYEPAMDRPKAEQLVEAVTKPAYQAVANCKRGIIPDWAVIVVGSSDVQIDRIEWQTWAYGPSPTGESAPGIPAMNGALIDWGVIEHSPEDATAWAQLSQVRNRTYPSETMVPLTHERGCFGVDTGGAYTSESYKQIARHSGLRALKGSSQQDAPPLKEAARRKRGLKRSVPLFLVGVHNLKKQLYFGLSQALASMETGQRMPGALYLPPETPQVLIEQMTSEFLVPVREANRTQKWVCPKGRANEAIDMAVYALGLAKFHGLDRFDRNHWDSMRAVRLKTDDTDTAPMEAFWSGNGDADIANDAEAEAQPTTVAARVTNPTGKPAVPDWIQKQRKANAAANRSKPT